MLKFPADESTVLILLERVNEAQRLAVRELKEMQANDPRNKKRRRGEGDEGGGTEMTEERVSSSEVAAEEGTSVVAEVGAVGIRRKERNPTDNATVARNCMK